MREKAEATPGPSDQGLDDDPERVRISAPAAELASWRQWGPYLSDRSWGTVREDYSEDGSAWDYFPHDLARSKTYRWGEDGIAGFCDRYQVLCLALALWNEKDPILKERYFGLVPREANHGEDVKELYFYLDAIPSHAYQRMLYKYPQAEYPYCDLIDENRRRGSHAPEYEIIDTGLFNEGRYFDVFVEVAKFDARDLAVKITAWNRGPDRAPIHLLPHLWFRNTWSWLMVPQPQPRIRTGLVGDSGVALLADDSQTLPLPKLLIDNRLGPYTLYAPPGGEALFTDNETNAERVYGPGHQSKSRYTKDAFHRRIVGGDKDAVNPDGYGTKAAIAYRFEVDPGEAATIRLRLRPGKPDATVLSARDEEVDRMMDQRKREADRFYAGVHPVKASAEENNVQRQALAGMLWSKQAYLFDVDQWLEGDRPDCPPPAARKLRRNRHWRHLNSMRILTMPDKWEYPWFAAWDLAFHTLSFALIDPEFAKEQLWLLLFEQFQHHNGQIPAYEWEFSDLNPPVHAWAVWRVYHMDLARTGRRDRAFLERCFHKLLINFAFWVNKVDSAGNNVFEGGFLGLDNITVIDRSDKLPNGAVLRQSDGTGWMGMFCLNLMRIALELAGDNPVYEGLATKFFEHYVYIGAAIKGLGAGGQTLWDADDGFFYDLLCYPDGSATSFRLRSLVGLIPLYAVERLDLDWIANFTSFKESLNWFLRYRADVHERCVSTVETRSGTTYLLSVVDQDQLKGLLARVVNPDEFLSAYGMRSLSRHHGTHPFVFGDAQVGYEPGEATSNIKGGNSNWRGPVWFPTSF